jgi:5-methylcytosine-specific restriction endonuclease McrA
MCDDKDNLTIHHLIPVDDGGESNIENLIVLCYTCHDVVESENLRDVGLIRNWPNHNDKPIVKVEKPAGSDWHEWVYGGARNPMKDLRSISIA